MSKKVSHRNAVTVVYKADHEPGELRMFREGQILLNGKPLCGVVGFGYESKGRGLDTVTLEIISTFDTTITETGVLISTCSHCHEPTNTDHVCECVRSGACEMPTIHPYGQPAQPMFPNFNPENHRGPISKAEFIDAWSGGGKFALEDHAKEPAIRINTVPPAICEKDDCTDPVVSGLLVCQGHWDERVKEENKEHSKKRGPEFL